MIPLILEDHLLCKIRITVRLEPGKVAIKLAAMARAMY
jgi:hypothetical protein